MDKINMIGKQFKAKYFYEGLNNHYYAVVCPQTHKMGFFAFCLGALCVGGFVVYVVKKTKHMSHADRVEYVKTATGICIATIILTVVLA